MKNYGTTDTATYRMGPAEQVPLAGFNEAVAAMEAMIKKQEASIRAMFISNGYDIDAGDWMFIPRGYALFIPPRYRSQVREHPLIQESVMFMKNPAYGLF